MYDGAVLLGCTALPWINRCKSPAADAVHEFAVNEELQAFYAANCKYGEALYAFIWSSEIMGNVYYVVPRSSCRVRPRPHLQALLDRRALKVDYADTTFDVMCMIGKHCI